ncbi:sigma factor-binding protein Crl [Vibrio hannami]|uniref:sigma factor-binding protein Crl n=1 Tax=Vibrio hannami TaxID=2717094 RepID=UPI00240EC71F|nr:sigma factor-binding protein Crl [Vibrio hannami]MDG3087313.1 sigma factor-binding protein Crl [Vibrio hannami]
MTEVAASPTHYRLLSALKAIGPYLREPDSSEDSYLFDCLSACVDDKKSPEEREFWGWWMELTVTDSRYIACFKTGIYNLEGVWEKTDIPANASAEVTRTQQEFVKKLTAALKDRFDLGFELHPESEEFV